MGRQEYDSVEVYGEGKAVVEVEEVSSDWLRGTFREDPKNNTLLIIIILQKKIIGSKLG